MSGTIKENLIPQETSTDPEVLKDMFVRFVTALGTGSSKNKKLSELILKIANIYGLQTALDSKIRKNVSGGKGIIPTYLADGDIDFSTFKIGTFDNAANIGSLTDNGFYTAKGTGYSYYNYVMGYVVAVITINNTQIILSSDRGIWYRVYSGSWSIPSYIGGSVNNIPVSRAQADWLVANDSLTPGAFYSIFDHAEYANIIIQAATGSSFLEECKCLAVVPVHRYGTYTVGGDPVVFVGQWFHNLGSTAGRVAIHGNRCWVNKTGARGTQSNFALDATNWTKIDFRLYPEFYNFEWHTCVYDYTNDYVKEEWDNYGNRFGDITIPETDDGFRCHMNDWGLNYDFEDASSEKGNRCIFKRNVVKRFYGTTPCEKTTNEVELHFEGNRGTGWIRNMRPYFNLAGAFQYHVSNNIFDGESLGGNYTVESRELPMIDGLLMYINSGYPVAHRFEGNRIYSGGKITGLFGIYEQRTCIVSDNDIHGTISTSIGSGGMDMASIVRNKIVGNLILSGSSITYRMYDSYISNGVTITIDANSNITDSAFFTTRTVSGTLSRQERKGSIFASLYIGTGEFSFARGGTFNTPTLGSGCLVTNVASNGVTVTGGNISNLAVTIVHTGYYIVDYNSSAQSPIKIDVESKAYKGATAIPLLFNKKTYTAADEWINSSISGIVLLTAGDTLTVRYASPGSGTAALLLGQINIMLKYIGQ